MGVAQFRVTRSISVPRNNPILCHVGETASAQDWVKCVTTTDILKSRMH